MRTVHVQELSAEKFGLYGTFADMLHAAGPHIGTNPIEFYRNMTTVYSPGASVGLSITKVYRRPLVIDTYEYHNTCAEAMLPLVFRFRIQNISRPEAHRTAAVNRAELLLVPLDVEQAVVHLLCVQLPALELMP